MLQEFIFKGTIVLEFTQKKLCSNDTKTKIKKFDYCEIVYAKDVYSAQEKRYFLINKYINREYNKPVNWNALRETSLSVQGCLGGTDVRRVQKVKFIQFENISIFSKDISDWSIDKCKRNMTPQEYKEHCES